MRQYPQKQKAKTESNPLFPQGYPTPFSPYRCDFKSDTSNRDHADGRIFLKHVNHSVSGPYRFNLGNTNDTEKQIDHLSSKKRAMIELLDSWLENVDEESRKEQQDTLAFLKKALDKDRTSYRKLFP